MMATTVRMAPTASGTETARRHHRVVMLDGDGIGPEIMRAARAVLAAVEAPVDLVDGEVDRTTGLPEPAVFDELDRGAVLLKAPMATPIGAGHKSPNVTLRKLLELYANVRPSRSIPGLPAPCGNVDLIVVRENVEDLYAGIEHAQTDDVLQCLKLVSRSGSAAISRLAFDLAESLDRRAVTCVTKANIMKLTDGALLEAFGREAASRGASTDHVLVDAAACELVRNPGRFDVVVTSNLYGDILSDLAAGLTGGLGIAPSMNVGTHCAMFEPVHGSAPDIAGREVANPTAMILSTAMMLRYLGDEVGAEAIERAVDAVYASGRIRTADVAIEGVAPVSCTDFACAVATHAARTCERDRDRDRDASAAPAFIDRVVRAETDLDTRAIEFVSSRRDVGVDVFVEWGGPVDELAAHLQEAASDGPLDLWYVTNRGLCVWPTRARARLVDHFRCRFTLRHDAGRDLADQAVLDLLGQIGRSMRWMHVERLELHDGEPAFSAAYGAPA